MAAIPAKVRHEDLPDTNAAGALELVEGGQRILVDQFGFKLKSAGNGNDGGDHQPGGDPESDIETLRKALAVIPNNCDWDGWNRIGMAVYAATGGIEAGFSLFDEWSRKWPGYNATDTRKRWEAYRRSPPSSIGAGTVYHLAWEAAPGWRNAPDPPQDGGIPDFLRRPQPGGTPGGQSKPEPEPAAPEAAPEDDLEAETRSPEILSPSRAAGATVELHRRMFPSRICRPPRSPNASAFRRSSG
jgi:hypothetical protein